MRGFLVVHNMGRGKTRKDPGMGNNPASLLVFTEFGNSLRSTEVNPESSVFEDSVKSFCRSCPAIAFVDPNLLLLAPEGENDS